MAPNDEITPESSDRGWGGAGIVLAVIMTISVSLGFVLLRNYTMFTRYVRDTLEDPVDPRPWEVEYLTVEQCVDVTLEWAEGCRGVKAMCDEYVPRVMIECMHSQDREAYCENVGDLLAITAFGHEECQARGVQRNVDAEACSAAYRGIDDYCARFSDEPEETAER